MTKPSAKPTFQPAPRPQSRTSAEQAHQLAAATGDLGFTRASTAPEPPSPQAPKSPKVEEGKSPLALEKPATLKFEIPGEVWSALRHKAIERRVTVRYLVLEALASAGYEVDLAAIPEDGRRNR